MTDPAITELVDVFNAMLEDNRQGTEGRDALQAELDALKTAMHSHDSWAAAGVSEACTDLLAQIERLRCDLAEANRLRGVAEGKLEGYELTEAAEVRKPA